MKFFFFFFCTTERTIIIFNTAFYETINTILTALQHCTSVGSRILAGHFRAALDDDYDDDTADADQLSRSKAIMDKH